MKTLGAILVIAAAMSPSLNAQIVCPSGADCRPGAWTAEDIRAAALRLEGCWAFELSGQSALRSPFSGTEYDFPIAPSVELTREETFDTWADIEGVRHELAFRVRGQADPRAAYWIPDPSEGGLLVKWREERSNASHFVLTASVTGDAGIGSVFEPGSHIGVVLADEVSVRRCTVS